MVFYIHGEPHGVRILYNGRRSNGKSDNGLCSQYQRANAEMRDCNVMWPCNDYLSTIANGKQKCKLFKRVLSARVRRRMYYFEPFLYLRRVRDTERGQKKRTANDVHS